MNKVVLRALRLTCLVFLAALSACGDPQGALLYGGKTTQTVWKMGAIPVSQYNWNSVAYGNGIFLAVAMSFVPGTKPLLATSSDGVEWTLHSAPMSGYSVTFGNGKFVIASGGSAVWGPNMAASADGIEWVNSYWSEQGASRAVTYGNGLFLVTGYGTNDYRNGAISSDGVHWTKTTVMSCDGYSASYFQGQYVVLPYGSFSPGFVETSPDGVHWDQHLIPLDHDMQLTSAATGNGITVVVGGKSASSFASSDWYHWKAGTMPDNYWTSVVFGNGKFFSVASGSGTSGAVSTDGTNWSAHPLPDNPGGWSQVVFGNGRFLILGCNGTTLTSTLESTPANP